ncbi:MAG: hypothetical protein P8181_16825 [bacterium]
MRYAATALTAVLAVAMLVCVSFAGPPLNGDYDSDDIGGPTNVGRYTESWSVPNGALLLGTTLNAESWDGMNLGLQWRYYCSTQTIDPVLLVDNVDVNGNGNRTYMKTFTGGYIWLSGAGPWGNGDPEYTGPIDTYHEFETIQYTNWVRTHAVTNVQATAHFDGYPNTCMVFSVGNGLEIGSTDFGMVKPADYPDLLQEGTCDPVMTMGGWWDFFTLTLSISNCTVPTENATWGAIKAQYE